MKVEQSRDERRRAVMRDVDKMAILLYTSREPPVTATVLVLIISS